MIRQQVNGQTTRPDKFADTKTRLYFGLVVVIITAICGWRLNRFWGGSIPMALAFAIGMVTLFPWRKLSEQPNWREFWRNIAEIMGFIGLYWVLFARGFLSGSFHFAGDTWGHWSLNYLALNSIRDFCEFPWWDPTIYNGYPLYFHVISGWSNYLSPFYLPSLWLFQAASTVFDVSINGFIAFHRTIYVFTMALLPVYIISRILVRHRMAALFAPLVFTLGYFQLLNLHDFYAYECLPGPLYVLAALIYHNKRRTPHSLCLLVLAAAALAASLDNAVMMSAFFWVSVFSLLMLALHPALIPASWRAFRVLISKRKGIALVFAGVIALGMAFYASFTPPSLNLADMLKYRGGVVEYATAGGFTNDPIPIETSELWTILFCWIPFSDVHGELLRFAWSGHDYRYIGMATLPLLASALILGYRVRMFWVLILSFFLCNGFLIYTTRNLAYLPLVDNVDLIRNTRNMLTIFPRGGPILFAVWAASMGLDRLLSQRKTLVSGSAYLNENVWTRNVMREMYWGFVLVSIGMLGLALKFDFVRNSFAHMGIYLALFAVLGQILLAAQGEHGRKLVVSALLMFTATDLVISASHHLDRGGSTTPRGVVARFPVNQLAESEVIPEDARFGPMSPGSRPLFGDYIGIYHNPELIQWGKRAWLTLATREAWQPLLENWDPRTLRMRDYPAFRFYDSAHFVPFDVIKKLERSEEILSRDPRLYLHDKDAAEKLRPNEPLQARYDVLHYSLNKVVMRTETNTPCYLLFLDNYDQFWSARIDGKQLPIHLANFCFKAIELPTGAHEVEWNYYPKPVAQRYGVFYVLFVVFAGLTMKGASRLHGPQNPASCQNTIKQG